jgi:hypothetical protein
LALGLCFAGSAALGLAGCEGGQDFGIGQDPTGQADSIESQTQELTDGTVVALEAENLTRTASSVGSKITAEANANGGKYVEFNGTAGTGAWIEFTLPNIEGGNYDLKFLYKSNSNRGIIQASIDGVNQGSTCNEYAASAAYKVSCSLGNKTLRAGNHQIRFTVTGKAAGSTGYQMVVDQISLTAKAKSCDIFSASGTPCVAAYSMLRSLSSSYTGPLFQVRAGSSSTNTGSGGTTKDIGRAADGYADTATVDSFCANTVCTVSVLYDQSGSGNNLRVAKKGSSAGGATGAEDDYEASATKGPVMVGGRKVYSLYMNKHEGYRTAPGAKGANVPVGSAPQSIYELADGTHVGAACCWNFGNVTTDPTKYSYADALFFGTAYWGKGAGSGPWFMVDFEGGVWAGGSKPGDQGWGGLTGPFNPNPNNPSLKVPFALGVTKVRPAGYAIRVADMQTATDLSTAFEGALPMAMSLQGGLVLGVGTDNSNSSWGTFYEGAIVSGYTTTDADFAVLSGIKSLRLTK